MCSQKSALGEYFFFFFLRRREKLGQCDSEVSYSRAHSIFPRFSSTRKKFFLPYASRGVITLGAKNAAGLIGLFVCVGESRGTIFTRVGIQRAHGVVVWCKIYCSFKIFKAILHCLHLNSLLVCKCGCGSWTGFLLNYFQFDELLLEKFLFCGIIQFQGIFRC